MMLKWPNDFYHVTPTHQHHLGAVCPYLKIGTKKIKVKKGKKEPKKEKICTNKNADSKDNLKKMIRWEIDLFVCAWTTLVTAWRVPMLVSLELSYESAFLFVHIFKQLLLFSSKLCLTLCNPIDCSGSGFSFLHCLPESAQIHVHWVSHAI